MSLTTVGTCGNCGGPVQAPIHWGGTEPTPKKCARCGATPVGEFGPVLPMGGKPRTQRPTQAYDLVASRRGIAKRGGGE